MKISFTGANAHTRHTCASPAVWNSLLTAGKMYGLEGILACNEVQIPPFPLMSKSVNTALNLRKLVKLLRSRR
jgi:hypothetical protein